MKRQLVAAVVQRGDRFLLGLRAPWKKLGPNRWSPIAGSVDPGESEPEAAIRECREELGVETRALRKVTSFDIESGTLNWWLIEIVHGEPHLANDEHTELKWFTVDEMRTLPNSFPEDIEVFASMLG